MEYYFEGLIKSYKGHSLPFVVRDGRLRLDVSSLSFDEIHSHDANGNIVFSDSVSFSEDYLEGLTDEGKIIKLHISKYYDADYSFFETEKHFIGGIVSSCIVLDEAKYMDNIDKVSFYSYSINKILGSHISGAFTENNLKLLGFKKELASYVENNNRYYVCHDFLSKVPYCKGQTISIKSDKLLTMPMMEDIYWTMRQFFAFMYQIKEPPLIDVCLHSGDSIIGHLFIKKYQTDSGIIDDVKCLQINSWKDKLSNLFQALVDKKIYLRHLPDHDNERRDYSAARFITTVIGFESVLNVLKIGADYSEKHREAIENVKNQINKLKETSISKYEKDAYSKILKDLEYDRLESRYENAIKQNVKYIKNFYVFSKLGESVNKVASELAKSRNNFSHGVLDEDLSWKHADYCDFLDLFILYLQLVSIEVPKEIAYVTVPQIMFSR